MWAGTWLRGLPGPWEAPAPLSDLEATNESTPPGKRRHLPWFPRPLWMLQRAAGDLIYPQSEEAPAEAGGSQQRDLAVGRRAGPPAAHLAPGDPRGASRRLAGPPPPGGAAPVPGRTLSLLPRRPPGRREHIEASFCSEGQLL